MKRLYITFYLIITLLVAVPAFCQTTMTTVQKVKLTLVPTPAATIPVGTLMVWSVEGSSATNVLGTFADISDEFAVYYLPVKGGSHVIRGGCIVGGQSFTTTYTITVTFIVIPTSIAITAGTPIPK